MPGKRIIWDFDEKTGTIFVSNESTGADKEKDFTFKLTRNKFSFSRRETLKIECKYKNEYNGHIDTSIQNLNKDIFKFMEYGVSFSDGIYNDIKQKIKDSYLLLNINEIEEVDIKNLKVDIKTQTDILNMIGEYLSYGDGAINGFYHIPVDEFNILIMESEFYKYNITDIKKWLRDCENPYIKCSKNRLDNLVKLNKKPTRAISFYEKHMEPIVSQYIKENRKSEK